MIGNESTSIPGNHQLEALYQSKLTLICVVNESETGDKLSSKQGGSVSMTCDCVAGARGPGATPKSWAALLARPGRSDSTNRLVGLRICKSVTHLLGLTKQQCKSDIPDVMTKPEQQPHVTIQPKQLDENQRCEIPSDRNQLVLIQTGHAGPMTDI